MTSGCSGGAVQSLPPAAVAVDLAPTRCPKASQRDRAEARRVTPPPAADLTKEKVDELRASEIRKNATIDRVIGELDRCSGTPATVKGPSVS